MKRADQPSSLLQVYGHHQLQYQKETRGAEGRSLEMDYCPRKLPALPHPSPFAVLSESYGGPRGLHTQASAPRGPRTQAGPGPPTGSLLLHSQDGSRPRAQETDHTSGSP